MGLFVSKIVLFFNLTQKISGKLLPLPFGNMVSLVSRKGRHLQRYNTHGYRQVVGYVLFFIFSPLIFPPPFIILVLP